MSNFLHPNANIGSFLPDVRETVLVDANMELNGLIDHAVSTLFPEEDLGEERNFMLRGLLIRVQALTNVMYGASCSADRVYWATSTLPTASTMALSAHLRLKSRLKGVGHDHKDRGLRPLYSISPHLRWHL